MDHVRVAWKIQNELMKFIGWPSKVGCVFTKHAWTDDGITYAHGHGYLPLHGDIN